ncbi:MAG: hypothetical protein Edafosvirus3_43 [Edafosvirus sp.]|uniref:Uncharacterized protein n=1 Tax=Edafosvirus sp. TaxID=2487765 RepID=A0A3G4ZSV2_9VIRU|nr:MAG: hypothetical protein Edafosvirus3_43 [Edafosvirus sp.]
MMMKRLTYLEGLLQKMNKFVEPKKPEKTIVIDKKSVWCIDCNQCKSWQCDNCGTINYKTALNLEYELMACSKKCVIELNKKYYMNMDNWEKNTNNKVKIEQPFRYDIICGCFDE